MIFCKKRLNDSGNIVKTCYNNQVRSRIMISNPDETKAHYEAQKLFNNFAYSKKFLLEYKLKNGKFYSYLIISLMLGNEND